MEKILDLIVGMFAGLSGKQMHVLILVSAVMVCIGTVCLVYHLYKRGRQLQEEETGKKLYESLEEVFREEPHGAYYKLQKWLKAIGAEHAVKGFGDPFQFVLINILLFVGVMLLFGLLGGLFAGIVVATVLLITEILVLIAIDAKSNREMLDDISFLYDATAIQLSSNIYIARAIANCLTYIRNKRLHQALTQLCGNLALGGDVRAATKDFAEKFHNEYLSTFCNAVVQITAKTGEEGKLIEDMAKQLTILKETTFVARKKSTENKLQLCIIGIFIMFTVLIFFLCIASMMGSTDILF